MGKKALCLIFAFLFSIESFAAVVSDNDGSAFITKAEFDSLKNDFQSQIDSYNINIDNKIDAAIAGYIAGIKVEKWSERIKLVGSNDWVMWTSTDYPKYEEGKPYIHGDVANGHYRGETDLNVTWIGLNLAGKSAYKTNGGFKKHFVDEPDTTYRNGNGIIINGGKYNGYWIDEGEDILLSGWSANMDSNYYALQGEQYQVFKDNNSFSNKDVDASGTVLYAAHTMGRTDNGWNTELQLRCQMASRIVGKQSWGTNVTIFDEINDNRFYDTNGANRVGIWQSTPEIPRQANYSNFASWWTDIAGSRSVKYATIRLTGASSASGPWPNTEANQGQNYSTIGTATTWGGGSISSYTHSYLKMSNIAYNIQFKNLWNPLLDSAAYTARDFYTKHWARPEVIQNLENAFILDSDYTYHLSLKAGYPLISVEKNEKVQWTITNKTNKVVNIYGKYGPFSLDDIAPSSEAEINWTNGKETNKKLFELPANGTSTIKFDVIEDGIVFLKWVASDGKSAHIDVRKNPIVQKTEE